ncbi:hypothetical protein GCM10020358_22030 [Amorphoplanes nipponensis]|uniref:Uncharacterized protein n=1 Tax=Actinoplanes nipponensis TaxID=135950 RepID=A0A919MN02_9ACTN|nr:hypothetical protein Ani05nite_14920 [Actinoplanes nipponensis]
MPVSGCRDGPGTRAGRPAGCAHVPTAPPPWRRTVLPRLTPESALALMLSPPEGYAFDFTTPLSAPTGRGPRHSPAISA